MKPSFLYCLSSSCYQSVLGPNILSIVMFSGTDHVTKFDVTGNYVYLYVFLILSPCHVSSELTHRQAALFCMLYILCLRIVRVPLEASAAVAGCHRDMSHTLDPVLDKRYAWQGNKTATSKEDCMYPSKTACEVHPTSSTMGTRSFPGVKQPGLGFDYLPHLSLRLRKE